MRSKPVILLFCLLFLALILFFAYDEKKNITLVNQAIAGLDFEISQLEMEKERLNTRLSEFQNILETIPPTLLMGFEDPETGFVEFLDFLQNPNLHEVEGRITLRDHQKFQEVPVPLHQTDFAFRFNFLNTAEAEKSFNFLLLQKKYPLQVNSLKISRGSEGTVDGALDVSLLLPAKLQFPSPEGKEGK